MIAASSKVDSEVELLKDYNQKYWKRKQVYPKVRSRRNNIFMHDSMHYEAVFWIEHFYQITHVKAIKDKVGTTWRFFVAGIIFTLNLRQ